jgi:hypothetical protein
MKKKEGGFPLCSLCGAVLVNFPRTMLGYRVEMRCKKCVQSRNPETYSHGMGWSQHHDRPLILPF